jgi:hypothetical protein
VINVSYIEQLELSLAHVERQLDGLKTRLDEIVIRRNELSVEHERAFEAVGTAFKDRNEFSKQLFSLNNIIRSDSGLSKSRKKQLTQAFGGYGAIKQEIKVLEDQRDAQIKLVGQLLEQKRAVHAAQNDLSPQWQEMRQKYCRLRTEKRVLNVRIGIINDPQRYGVPFLYRQSVTVVANQNCQVDIFFGGRKTLPPHKDGHAHYVVEHGGRVKHVRYSALFVPHVLARAYDWLLERRGIKF